MFSRIVRISVREFNGDITIVEIAFFKNGDEGHP